MRHQSSRKSRKSPVSNPTVIEPRLLTIPATALYLSTTVNAIRHLIWGKELAIVRCGQRYLLDRRVLDAWVEKQSEKDLADDPFSRRQRENRASG